MTEDEMNELTTTQLQKRIAANDAKIAANEAANEAYVLAFFERPDVIEAYGGDMDRLTADRNRLAVLGDPTGKETLPRKTPNVTAFREMLK